MKEDFINIMKAKSDEDLQTYIDERLDHEADGVFAAIDEFKIRGFEITREEILEIGNELEENGSLINFKYVTEIKTDEELQKYIEERENHSLEGVKAAVNELRRRGFEISEEDLTNLMREMYDREWERNKDKKTNRDYSNTQTLFTENITESKEAPLLFSKLSIFIFGFLFGSFFASCMFAANLERLKIKKGFYEVIGYGTFITILQVYFGRHFHSYAFPILINCAAVFAFFYYFWNAFIGKELKYRKRPIWIPLITGIVLMIFLIWLYIHFLPPAPVDLSSETLRRE